VIGWRPVVVDGREHDAPITESEAPTVPRAVAEIPLLLVLAIGIAFVVKTFVAQAFYIPSGSMLPQLKVGDRIVVSKLAYDLHDPRRGDIVVFDCPPRASCPEPAGGILPVRVVRGLFEAIGLRQPSTEEYVKRVIGLPGDQVQGAQGRVFVNGRALIEPYLPSGTVTADFGPVRVPDGQLWVMGDNRSQSADSRVFGPITTSSVVGRAVVRAWPVGSVSFL
jgi:signal peptidase I